MGRRSKIPGMPVYHELLWPTLEAVRDLGGSATIAELNSAVLARLGLGEDIESVVRGSGPQTEIEYRLAWARSNLKWIGMLDNSGRGVWSVTDRGRAATPEQVRERDRERRKQASRERAEQPPVPPDGAGDPDDPEEENPDRALGWKERLLARLLELDPRAFERLTQRLLREAGFVNVSVTGRSGDGGIDAVGVYRFSLVSFPVFVQAKRYAGSVGSGAVRDFRGAMEGRGEKGLLITTGVFTRDAQNEATRDGARPVDLVDGDRLCDLLRQYGLGVHERRRVEIDVDVDEAFFDDV